MALGTYTHIAAADKIGQRTVVFRQQLTSGANHVKAGSALDLSAATRGPFRGFHTRVDGVKFIGWFQSADTDFSPADQEGVLITYVRAAAGAPATGLLRLNGGALGVTSRFESLSTNHNLSAVIGVFEAVGE